MRSVVPIVAGLMQMPVLRFVLAVSIAAILWSILYIFPGIIVGALSLELAPAAATKFILIILAIVAFGWIVLVLIHLFFKTLSNIIDNAAERSWQWLASGKKTAWITTKLSSATQPNPHRQLLLLLFAFVCGCVFLWIFASVVLQGYLTQLNQPIFELLRSLHTRVGDDVMLVVTFLGDRYVQLIAGAALLIWLVWRRYIWAGLHWFGALLLAFGGAGIIKHLYYYPRPTGLLHQQLDSSFPSGHVTLTTTLFVFLAMLIARQLPEGRHTWPCVVAGFLIIMVLLSRLYLGAHWFTDVAGALFFGLTCATLMMVSYQRYVQPVPAGKLAAVAGGIFLVVWLVYSVFNFRQQQEDYTLYWPTVKTDTATWWQQPHAEMPLFIVSRLSKPNNILNVQWLGQLDDIKQTLIAHGWQERDIHLNWKGSLHRLSSTANPEHLPVLPWLYQNQPPVLLMTKPDAMQNNLPLYFVLWKSNVTLSDNSQPLWVGSVHYFIPRPSKQAISMPAAETQQLYAKALVTFTSALQDAKVDWKVWTLSTDQQPPVMLPLNWDGKLLLIKPR